jgi:enediyne biosynthesis protein E4
MTDINHDGLMDIYICKGGFRDADSERHNLLYVNQGNQTFKEEAKQYGIDDDGYSMQAVFFDMDNDNDLDLYLSARPDSFYLGLSQMTIRKRNPPENCRNKLYRNDSGHFTEIGKTAGIAQTYGYGLSVTNADLNKDGYEDIFITNDYADNDYMFINQKNGTFKDEIKRATNHVSLFSMGSDIADINNDGLEDIVVMEMLPENYKRSKVSMPRMDVQGFWAIVDSGFQKQYMHNALHLNQGNLFFSDVSQLAGVSKTEWSWSTLASDFDNDGNRDIFVANGYRRDLFDGDIQQKQDAYVQANVGRYKSSEDMFQNGFKDYINIYDPIKVRNYLFKNKGGLQFENVSQAWGFKDSTFSNGAAVADLDNDGDLDLVINNLDEPSQLYENTTNGKSNYLRLKLEGPESNHDGIGAKVSLFYDGKMQQYFEQKVVRGYLSSNDPVMHFGLGKTTKVDSVVISWLDGKENVLRDVAANATAKVEYKSAVSGHDRSPRYDVSFATATDLLAQPFKHQENVYDEYKDQVLLPHAFSRSGTFIATGDVNGDGTEDFFIGGAAKQAGRLYTQVQGRFVQQAVPAFEADKDYEDMGCTLFDADKDGDLDLYVVSGGSEFPDGASQYQDRLYLNDGKGHFTKTALPKTSSSGSCVLAFDFDGDGDLDIFRGGQVMPHGYPQAPRSYLLVNQNGAFTDQTVVLAPALSNPGMVNAAVWTDLNGDKRNELVITGEWMPIRVFDFSSGKFGETGKTLGFEDTEGWWNRLLAADVDGDGDMDLIAGNLGENYKFKASAQKPFEVYAKDFDNNGTNDVFLAKYNGDQQVPVRGRECTSQQCKFISEKFPTYLSFAESDLKTILGEEIESALHYKANMMSSVIFVNDKGHFTAKKLPVEAQLSTVNCILFDDFDKDGKKDILIAGNKFDVEVETTPADASVGVLLHNIGNMDFESRKPMESGFFAPYNVKDMQRVKLNNKWAILVSSNDDSLRVFSTTK